MRIEEGDRGQDEETQGETQTRNGFGFPQHLREEERERTASAKTTKQPEKKRGQQTLLLTRGGS